MDIRLGQASISEFGTKWGEPGNQKRTSYGDDGELNIVPYKAEKWHHLFRFKDAKLRKQAKEWMIAIVRLAKFGYSQNNGSAPREGAYNELKRINFDINRINEVKPCNCDCSSLIMAICNALGVKVITSMYTGSQVKNLTETGAFEVYSGDYCLQAKNLQEGDILLRDGHTAMVLDTYSPEVIGTYVATGNVWARYMPATRYGKYKAIPRGTELKVSDIYFGWARVYYEGQWNWASLTYLEKKEEKLQLPDVMYVTGAQVNVRTGAGTGSKIKGIIHKDDELILTKNYAYAGERLWVEGSANGISGWVSTLYLTEQCPLKEITMVTTGKVYMRSSTNTANTSNVLTVLELGTKVTWFGETSTPSNTVWYKVKYNGLSGWVSGKYLSVSDVKKI